MKTAQYWIEILELVKHPEGGYYKEVYRSDENIYKNALPSRYSGDRNVATSIYFLINGDEFSSFHRIQSDETWHFYQGTTLELLVIDDHGKLMVFKLGVDLEAGEQLQHTIPRNHWFAARVIDKGSYTLVGCTVAPGFHFDDFELAERSKLIGQFPKHKKLIEELTFDQ